MNKLFLIIFLSISAFATINEHKIDLYFGNGIDTSYESALATADDLGEKYYNQNISLRDMLYEKNEEGAYDIEVKLAYNHTFGMTNDLAESIYQWNKRDLEIKDYGYIGIGVAIGYIFIEKNIFKIMKNMNLGIYYLLSEDGKKVFSLANNLSKEELTEKIHESFENKLINEEQKETSLNLINSENFEMQDLAIKFNQYDIQRQLDAYKESIYKGHRVIAVAHSQGTLFVTDVYDKLESWEQKYFDAFGIGAADKSIIHKTSDKDYLTVKSDMLFNIGLFHNEYLTEEEKEIYKIGIEEAVLNMDLMLSASGHFIKNYLQIPRIKNLIFDRIEDKIINISKIESQYKAEYLEDNCAKNHYTHRYNDSLNSFYGITFNKNSKVYKDSSSLENGIESNFYFTSFQELFNNEIYCYESLPNKEYLILKNLNIPSYISITLEDNKGKSVLTGTIEGYSNDLDYKGYLYDENGEKVQENIYFKILEENDNGRHIFESAFKQNTNGRFVFKIEATYKNQPPIDFHYPIEVTIENLPLDDDILNVTRIDEKTLTVEYYDENAIKYNLYLFKASDINQEKASYSLENTTLTSVTITDLEPDSYVVKLIKENKYGEKATLTRNDIYILSKDVIDVTYSVAPRYGYFRASYSISKKESFLDDYIIKLVDENENTEKILSSTSGYFQKNNTHRKIYNGDNLNYTFKVINSLGEEIDINKININVRKNIKVLKQPVVKYYENCEDINKSYAKFRYTQAYYAEKLYLGTDTGERQESEEEVSYYSSIYLRDFKLEDNISFYLEYLNYTTNKRLYKELPVDFSIKNSSCLKSVSRKTLFSYEKDDEGKYISVGIETNYTNTTYVPGKMKVYINDDLRKTIEHKNLKNNIIKNMFSVSENENATIKIELYGAYGEYVKDSYSYTFYN